MRGDRSVVQMHNALHDGYAKSDSSTVHLPSLIHAEKRLENLNQRFIGNSKTVIAATVIYIY